MRPGFDYKTQKCHSRRQSAPDSKPEKRIQKQKAVINEKNEKGKRNSGMMEVTGLAIEIDKGKRKKQQAHGCWETRDRPVLGSMPQVQRYCNDGKPAKSSRNQNQSSVVRRNGMCEM